MKRIFNILLAVVCVAGLSMLVLELVGRRAEVRDNPSVDPSQTKPAVAGRFVRDQALLNSVLESPERMDAQVAQTPVSKANSGEPVASEPVLPVCTLPTGKERQLLSDVEKPPAPQPLIEPVAADTLHFREDYASLRADAVRNPDSPENREGVVSLMKARQRRLGQAD